MSSSKLIQLVTMEGDSEHFYYRPYDLNYIIFTSLQRNEDGSVDVIFRDYQDDKEGTYQKGSVAVLKRKLKNISIEHPDLYNSLTSKVKGLHGHSTTVYHEGILLLIIKEMEKIQLSRFNKKNEVVAYWNELTADFLKKLEDFAANNGNMKRFGDFSLLKEYIKSKKDEMSTEELGM